MKTSKAESAAQDRRMAALFVVALILLASTVSLYSRIAAPRSGRDFISAVERRTSQAWWVVQRVRGATGDVESMYRLGLRMKREYRHDSDASGLPVDGEKGGRLVRVAADRGFLPAQLEVWRMDEGSTEQLKSMLPEDPAVFLAVHGVWNEMTVQPSWEGVKRCDADLLLYGEGVMDAWFDLLEKWIWFRTEDFRLERIAAVKQGRAEFMRRCVLKGAAAPLPRRHAGRG